MWVTTRTLKDDNRETRVSDETLFSYEYMLLWGIEFQADIVHLKL